MRDRLLLGAALLVLAGAASADNILISEPNGANAIISATCAGTPEVCTLNVNAVVAPAGTQDVNLTKVGGTNIAIGQGAMAASLPVVIASNQSTLTVTGAGGTFPATQSGTWNIGTVTAVTAISNALPAGTAILGKVGVDQTTPGTTNAISLAQIGANTVSTGNGVAGAGVQRVTIASDNTAFPVNATLAAPAINTYVGNVATEGTKTSYRGASSATLGATTTDFCTITGSGTKTIRVTLVTYKAFSTSGGIKTVDLVKRSTANSAGTSTAITAVPLDSSNAAATATPLIYTVNPTLGNTVGAVGRTILGQPASTAVTPLDFKIWDFTTRNAQGIVLRGTGQVLAVNMLGAAIQTGEIGYCEFEWTEE